MKVELFDAALGYLAKGISIIPVGKDKRPLISWKAYQTKRATEDEIIEWFHKFPEMQIGIVTGAISNLSVVDVESGGDPSILPQETCIVKTGGNGFHYYYKYAPGTHNTARKLPLTDTRSNGGYVIAPPSVTDKGSYEVIKRSSLLPFPCELFGMSIFDEKKRQNFRDISKGVGTGSRNQTAAQIIGLLTRYMPEYYWGTAVWPLVIAWNAQNSPPLPDDELEAVYNSICTNERFSKAKYNQSK